MRYKNYSWLRPGRAASGVLILIALIAIMMAGNISQGIRASHSAGWFFQVYGLVVTMSWVYLWLAFRQLLHACASQPQTDLFIYLLIGTKMVNVVFFSLIPISWSLWMGTAIWAGASFAILAFAFWLYSFPHKLFGYKEVYIWTLVAGEVVQLVIYQVVFRLFPDFAGDYFRAAMILMGVLRIAHLAMMFQIFDQAAKQSVGHVAADPNEALIDDIGRKQD